MIFLGRKHGIEKQSNISPCCNSRNLTIATDFNHKCRATFMTVLWWSFEGLSRNFFDWLRKPWVNRPAPYAPKLFVGLFPYYWLYENTPFCWIPLICWSILRYHEKLILAFLWKHVGSVSKHANRFLFEKSVGVQYQRIITKGLLPCWFPIRRLMEVRKRGWTCH